MPGSSGRLFREVAVGSAATFAADVADVAEVTVAVRSARYPWLAALVAFAGTTGGYLALGLLGGSVVVAGADLGAAFWIPYGAAVGLAGRLPWRLAPAVAAAVLVSEIVLHLWQGVPSGTVVGHSVALAAQLLLVVFLLKRARATRMTGPADVWLLVAVSVVAVVVCGLLGALASPSDGAAFVAELRLWIVGDLMAIVSVAPVVLTVGDPRGWSWHRAPEFLAATAVTGLATFYLYVVVTPLRPGLFGWPYLMLIGLVWLAARLGVAAVAPVAAAAFSFAGLATVNGTGWAAAVSSDPVERLEGLELFALVATISVLLLAVLTQEREGILRREQSVSRFMAVVFENSPVPAVRVTLDDRGAVLVRGANQALANMLGAGAAEILGSDLTGFAEGDVAAGIRSDIRSVVTRSERSRPMSAQSPRKEVRLRTASGGNVTALMSAALAGVPGGGPDDVEVVVQFEDVTARWEAERALISRELEDPVTGLPTRKALGDRIARALRQLGRSPGALALLILDLDDFRSVNNALGHHGGDELLADVGKRLQSVTRTGETVARLGGDEFAVMCEDLRNPLDAALVAMRLGQALAGPWKIGKRSFVLTVGVGVAAATTSDTTPEDLLRQADLALYRAKDRGRGRIETFDTSLDEEFERALGVQEDLRAAIDNDGLILHFQPVVSLVDESILGAEALVRMRGASGELVPPYLFIPQAEITGLVVPLGERVIHSGFATLRIWRDKGHEYDLAVNVSPAQLEIEGFAEVLLDAANSAGIDPSRVCVEVTETAFVKDPGPATRMLNRLREAGVAVALDDFGTGYSSLTMLATLPVDIVKIDRSFVSKIGEDPKSEAIIEGMIRVAHEMGLIVVAEGVETEAQRDLLRAFGCDRAQGYLFSRPVPASDPLWQ